MHCWVPTEVDRVGVLNPCWEGARFGSTPCRSAPFGRGLFLMAGARGGNEIGGGVVEAAAQDRHRLINCGSRVNVRGDATCRLDGPLRATAVVRLEVEVFL